MNIQARPPRPPLNGVDTPTLLSTIAFVAGQPELASFQFRAANEWIEGTHSRSAMLSFHGAGAEQKHVKSHFADGDHPTVLCGGDRGPTPVEWLLHALATCLTAGIANIAAARGVKLTSVRSFVEGLFERGEVGANWQSRPGIPLGCSRRTVDGGNARRYSKELVSNAVKSVRSDH